MNVDIISEKIEFYCRFENKNINSHFAYIKNFLSSCPRSRGISYVVFLSNYHDNSHQIKTTGNTQDLCEIVLYTPSNSWTQFLSESSETISIQKELLLGDFVKSSMEPKFEDLCVCFQKLTLEENLYFDWGKYNNISVVQKTQLV